MFWQCNWQELQSSYDHCLQWKKQEDKNSNWKVFIGINSAKNSPTYRIDFRFQLEYVVGWVFGEKFSSVTGYVIEDVFFGHIFVNNEMYYVDPFKVYFCIIKRIIS